MLQVALRWIMEFGLKITDTDRNPAQAADNIPTKPLPWRRLGRWLPGLTRRMKNDESLVEPGLFCPPRTTPFRTTRATRTKDLPQGLTLLPGGTRPFGRHCPRARLEDTRRCLPARSAKALARLALERERNCWQ